MLSQQNRRLEANRREHRGMVIYCSTNTNCARADNHEQPRTAIQGLSADFPSDPHQMAREGGEIPTRQERWSVRATLGALFRFGTIWTWGLGFDRIRVS